MHKRKENKYFEEIRLRNKHKIYRICEWLCLGIKSDTSEQFQT
jgi:hypothetical protein